MCENRTTGDGSFPFTSLPFELRVLVLEHLDSQHILRLRQCCTQLRDIIDNNIILRYKIELAFSGKEDGLTACMDIVTKLQVLRDHQAAWRSLDWTWTDSVAFDGHLWELAGGMLAFCQQDRRTFNFIRPAATLRGIDAKYWTLDLGKDVADFTMDPSQDLLVVVAWANSKHTRCRVKLLSLSTGKRHPAARKHWLKMTTNSPAHTFDIQIRGSHLSVQTTCLQDDVVDIFYWDWHTATQKFHDEMSSPCSACFLDDAYILIGRLLVPTDRTHLVMEPYVIRLEVYELDVPDVALCHFYLPLLGDTEVDFLFHTDSLPSSYPSAPFSTSMSERILIIPLDFWASLLSPTDIEDTVFVQKSYSMVISIPNLLRRVRSCTPRVRTSVISFPWHEWGPSDARLLDVETPDTWVCFAHGMRFILMTAELDFRIYDFGKALTGPLRPLPGDETGTQVSVADSRSIVDERVFLQEVTTSLPYQVINGRLPVATRESSNKHEKTEERAFVAAMLIEDGIVAVSMEEDSFSMWTV